MKENIYVKQTKDSAIKSISLTEFLHSSISF